MVIQGDPSFGSKVLLVLGNLAVDRVDDIFEPLYIQMLVDNLGVPVVSTDVTGSRCQQGESEDLGNHDVLE